MFLIRLLAFWFVVCLMAGQSVAQTASQKMIGEYYLTGVREVGAGIKLNADFTFDFFFSYGALDRLGHGTWKQQGSQLRLISRPRPPKDFALISSQTVPGDSITIRIVDQNKQLLQYVECAIKSGAKIQREGTDTDGEAHFLKRAVEFTKLEAEAISLRFDLCPDRYSVFPITDKAHNYFEFRFEPWISEAFFENVTYTISGNNFKGPLSILEPNETYQFKRQ
ncbi:hypothetical protein [Spirosoma flavum]|uniref:DUF3108 domain-containing protein n=1 Tax=Spirosoma flavum TaxID=2048557 RepID=A0ABW6AVH2_9BACT